MHDDIESRLRTAMEEVTRPVTGSGIDEDDIHETVARRQRNRRLGLGGAGVLLAAATVAGIVLLPSNKGDDPEIILPEDTSIPDPTVTIDPTTSTTEAAETTTSSTTATTEPQLPEFPEEHHSLEVGDEVWTLYLAIGPTGDWNTPEMAEAVQAQMDAGYAWEGPYLSDLTCEKGSIEGLGRTTGGSFVAVRFTSEAAANQAKAAFEARDMPTVGVVFVQIECLESIP